MKNTLKFFGIAFATASLFGCGSGSSSSSNNATGCITTESVDGGINFTNICDEDVNVAFFDPLFRFELEEGETMFLARTGVIRFGACEEPFVPEDDGDSFFCRIS